MMQTKLHLDSLIILINKCLVMKMRLISFIFFVFAALVVLPGHAQIIAEMPIGCTGGGSGYYFSFDMPSGLAVDRKGNIYVSQTDESNLVKVDVHGNLTYVIRGDYSWPWGFSGDGGPAIDAGVNFPQGLATDRIGNLYIADFGNNRIRKVDTSGIIHTIAGNGLAAYSGDGGPATLASINGPAAIAIDKAGDFYFIDAGNNRIRKIDTAGVITTIAGTGSTYYSGDGGPATDAGIGVMGNGIAVDTAGNVYFIDSRIRKISPSGIITAFAGNGFTEFGGDGGPALAAGINPGPIISLLGYFLPGGLACDRNGNLFISDGYNGRIRKVDTGGIITTIAGNGYFGHEYCSYTNVAFAKDSTIWMGGNIATDTSGNVYLIDAYTFSVSKVFINNIHIPFVCAADSLHISLCENGDSLAIDSLLTVFDDTGRTENWSVASPAMHGTVIASCSATSVDSVYMPHGITYTPDSGYTGRDSFNIRVSNGDSSAICKFFVDVKRIITAGSIIGDSIACGLDAPISLYDSISTLQGNWYLNIIFDGHHAEESFASGNSVVIRFLGIGIDTINFSNGCGFAAKVITINPVPSPITGSAVVCLGDTIHTHDTTFSGFWSASNSHLSISDSGIISGISNGVDTIFYSLPTGCQTSAIIGIGMTGTISGDSILCVYNEDTLHVVSIGGIWTNTNPSVAYGFYSGGMIVEGTESGIDTLIYSNSCGSLTKVITVNAYPFIGISSSLCLGDTVIITDSVAGGIWYYDTTLMHIDSTGLLVATAVSSGTRIVYSISKSCQASIEPSIGTVPGPLSGNAAICMGDHLSLADSIGGGVWSSSDSGTLNIIPYGLPYGAWPGVATITYSNGCGYVTKSVTVNASPDGISLEPSICMGDTLYATDYTPGGTWSTAFNHVSVSSTGTVTTVSTPLDYIYYTLPNGCLVASEIIVGNGVPTPIMGRSSVCVNDTIVLSDSAATGTWSRSNDINLITGTYSVHLYYYPYSPFVEFYGGSPGTDIISFNNGCGTTTKIITINPNPAPIIIPAHICIGETVTATDDSAGGIWSQWPGPTHISVSSDGLVTAVSYSSLGFDEVIYTLPTGCNSVAYEEIDSALSPASIPIVGDSLFCGYGTYLLYDYAYHSGSWSSSNPLVATIYADPYWAEGGELTTLTAGLTNISFTVTNACGSYAATRAITVGTPIGPVSGGHSICTGSTITLSDSAAGGFWITSNSNASLLSISPGVQITGISPGTDSISYSITNSCGTATSSVVVTINPLPNAGIIIGADSLCAGSGTLLLSTASGGVWSSLHSAIASVSDSGYVLGIMPGADSIKYKVMNTCGIDSVMHRLTIRTVPYVSAVTGLDSICQAHIFLYTDSVSGGHWYIANTNATISLIGVLTGVNPGLDTVYYVLSNFCGDDSAKKSVRILPSPHAESITGPDSVCQTAEIMLTDSAAGGVWYVSNAHATITGGTVFGISAGIDTVQYSVVNICGAATATHTVTVKPSPNAGTISGPDSVCVGQAITLSDTYSGGSWSAINASAGVSGGVVTGILAGNDSIVYMVTNDCGMARTSANITIVDTPSIHLTGKDYTCVGYTDTLISSPAGGEWRSANANASVISGWVTGLVSGYDKVFYTLTGVCGITEDSISITIYPPHHCDSVENVSYVVSSKEINIYPNPATHEIAVEGAISGDIIIRDMLGRISILQSANTTTQPGNRGDTIVIDVSKLPAGIYFVEMTGRESGGRVVKKMVKE